MSVPYKHLKSFISVNSNNVNDFILEVRTIILCIGNNSEIFRSPSPPLDSIAKLLDELEIAAAVVNENIPDSIAARNIQRDNLLKVLQDLYSYVITTAGKAEDESTAISIIYASGFGLINPVNDSLPDTNGEVATEV